MNLWHWFLHAAGADNPSGVEYGWWSGAGSDIGELAIIGAVIGTWHKHTCHVKGCQRIARQQVEGTTWHVCRKHHPADAPTAESILEDHEAAKR